MRKFRSIYTLISLVVLPVIVLSLPSCREGVKHPAEPTPGVECPFSDEDEKAGATMTRHEQFELMHSAGSDIDWRAFERQNCLAAMERRQQGKRGPGTWRELGSRNLAGRIHAAAWSTDGKSLYAGADRGGLWRGDLDGNNWIPLSDNVYGGVHELAVLPAPGGGPDILIRIWDEWWGTAFIFRSVDEGKTWSVPSGLDPATLAHAKRIIVMDDPDHTVFLLVDMNSEWQVLTSTDRGASFVKSRGLSSAGDIWTPRTGPGPLYLVDTDQISLTSDGGVTWTDVGNPLPNTGTALLLAGSETPDLRFNVGLGKAGAWALWRSEDAGLTWNKKSYLGSYFDYWQSLVASTQNGDQVGFGGTEMFTSWNGGAQWDKFNGWKEYYFNPEEKLHADIPGLYVFPDPSSPVGETWYIGTDGGLYDSRDGMSTVRNLSMSGLGVSQYYSTFTSRRKPEIVLGGSQDQGYQRGVANGPPPPPPGAWLDFVQLVGGDYGHLTSSNGSHDLVYSVHPVFFLVQEGEDDPVFYMDYNYFPPNTSYPWMPYIQADPGDPEAFFFCASQLYRYSRTAPNRWEHKKFSTQVFTPGFLTAIAFSPLDAQRVYASTSTGKLYHSSDGGVNWTLSANTGPGYMNHYGTALLPSSKDVDVCWAAGSGYANAPVYRTDDGGVTWRPRSNGLPSTLVYCLAEAPDQSSRIFCGSEYGAWVYDPVTEQWSDLLDTEVPITTFWCCESVPSKNLIRFGTYSRGIWDYHLNTPGYFPYGELLGGPHVLDLDNEEAPLIGKVTTFLVRSCQPVAQGALAISLASAEIPLAGGTLLVDPLKMFTVPFIASPSGEGTLRLRIPNDPAYVDMEFFFQAAAHDPGAACGWALSHGLRAVVGK